MLTLNIPPYEQTYVDGWLLLLDEGLYARRSSDTCIEVKNNIGIIKRIHGEKEHCDRCFHAFEGIPDYQNYTCLFHLFYEDYNYVLVENDTEQGYCYSWEYNDEDPEMFRNFVNIYQNQKANSKHLFVLLCGRYTIKEVEDSVNQFIDFVDHDTSVMCQFIENKSEKPTICTIFV